MAMYESFARVYDALMDNVPYEEWSRYLIRLMKEYGVEDGLVLELGCGTGSMTELLAQEGYDMIGVDNSADMLEIALEKREASGHDILYLLQDMREFELYGTVRAVVSVCDSMNYLTQEEDFLQVLRLVNNYLDPGGIFIFDLNTVFKYRELLGDVTIAENREECSFIWENTFYEEEAVNEYNLTLFLPREDGLYQRFEENHYQRAYELTLVEDLIRRSGMKLEAVLEAFSSKKPDENTERVYFVVREQEKMTKNIKNERNFTDSIDKDEFLEL